MAQRITKNAALLRDQLTTAIAGITAAGLSWPVGAPTVAAVTAVRDDIADSITDTDTRESAWKVAAQTKRTNVETGYDTMLSIDEYTDAVYGPSAAEKNNFGLTPKGAAIDPLHILVELSLTDGPVAGSLKFDWESIEGASYEVQWSSTSNFATITGSATSASASDYIISGLVPGTQYWTRVRPIRGGQVEAWSDPATRIAPI
jgi:hypothetical protein